MEFFRGRKFLEKLIISKALLGYKQQSFKLNSWGLRNHSQVCLRTGVVLYAEDNWETFYRNRRRSQLNPVVNINILKLVEGRTSKGLLWVTTEKMISESLFGT